MQDDRVLTEFDAASVLERQAAIPFVRGIRHKPTPGAMRDPRWRAGYARLARLGLRFDLQVACNAAQRFTTPLFSRSYFVPRADGLGVEVIDLCIPLLSAGRPDGFVGATIALAQLLDETIAPDITRGHELSFVEADGTRVARAGRQLAFDQILPVEQDTRR